jgi:hypothetical protein
MFELVLNEQINQPSVQKLAGPRIRLSMHPSQDIGSAISQCRPELHEAIEWALTTLHESDEAPHRVFVRDANGHQVLTMTDPCLNYGSQAIIRP